MTARDAPPNRERASSPGPGRIGVSGHRPDRLAAADPLRLDAVVDRVLGVLFARGHRVLVSGLAEGADRVVARRALAAEWLLEALLPFAPDAYEGDFASETSRAEFRDLLARSGAVEVVGGAEVAGRAEVVGEESPEAAYRAQGRQLAMRTVVLLSIWNGAPPRGPGGTGEVVDAARSTRTPVIWIHSEAPHEVRLVTEREVQGPWPESPDTPLAPSLSAPLSRALEQALMRAPSGSDGSAAP